MLETTLSTDFTLKSPNKSLDGTAGVEFVRGTASDGVAMSSNPPSKSSSCAIDDGAGAICTGASVEGAAAFVFKPLNNESPPLLPAGWGVA